MPATARALTDILFEQTHEFVGLYHEGQARFTRLSPLARNLLGDAALDTGPQDFLGVPAAQWQAWRAAAHGVGHFEAEAELHSAAGERFWALLTLTHFEAEGQPQLLVRLTEQNRLHQAELELAQSVRRFEAVVANATIGIVMCDRGGRIVSANNYSHQLLGYASGELLGLSIDALVPRGVEPRHEQLRDSFNEQPAVRAMGMHRGDLAARRKDGSVFPVEVSLSYFYIDQALYVVSYILDITYKKEAEQELIAQRQRVERLNAELEQKVADRTHALLSTLAQLEQRSEELTQALTAEQQLGELKSRFVSMASHEFRTPLTAVLTSAALIERYAGGEQQPQRLKHLQRIRASVMHLNDILEEFLSVGKIEEGKVVANPVSLQLPALLDEIVADLQGLLKQGQRIEQYLSCPDAVRLDPSLLRKILVNLLSNAIKYSGEDSVVALHAAATASMLTLRVQDHGVGISAEDQEHLFERFFRAHNVSNIPGTGLGLYIVARYLELLGGRISLHSQLGQGTTVTITIPLEETADDHHSAD